MKKTIKNKVEKKSNEILTAITISLNSYTLMLRNHFRSSSFYLGNIIIPLLVVLSCSILFPINYSFIWMLFISLSFTGFSTYGIHFFAIKKSTMIKNINMTLNESLSLYFAIFFLILTTTFITLVMIIISVMILDFLGIASHKFFFISDTAPSIDSINYLNIWWEMIIYYWFAQGLLTFSISFVIENSLNTQKNYFIVIFIYLLGGFFFGGIMSPTLISDGDVIKVWKEQEGIPPPAGVIIPFQWGKPLWYISQFWPHYGLNQLAASSLEKGAIYYSPEAGEFYDSPWLSIQFRDMAKSPESLYYIVTPWIYTIFSLWLGGTLNRFKKN